MSHITLHKQTVFQLLDKERERLSPSNTFILGDGLVNGEERDRSVKWLTQLPHLNLAVDTYALATKFIDKVISTRRVQMKYMRCVSLCCLYVASKLCEESFHVLSLPDYIHACDGGYSLEEMSRMERVILSCLKWRLAIPTVVDFIHAMLPFDDPWSTSLSDDVTSLLHHHKIVTEYPSSIIAAALLSIRVPLSSLLHISNYQLDWEKFLPCRLLIESVLVYPNKNKLYPVFGSCLKSSPRKRRRQKSKDEGSPRVKTPLDEVCIDDIHDALHIFNQFVPIAA